MKALPFLIPLAALPLAFALFAQAPAPAASSRGALLYETHCVDCHTKEMHWRAKRSATDWSSLAAEVRRWRGNLGLSWSEDATDDVVRYLNTTIYRFPDDAPRQRG